MKKNTATFYASLIAAAALTACGGGSDAGSTAGTTAPATYSATCNDGTTRNSTTSQAAADALCPAAVATSSIVTSVPAATYPAGSEELAAFNFLNAERSKCGFGLLAQNAQLDVSAKGHADYLLINGDGATGHNQKDTNLSFTGVTLNDRAIAAGYGNAAFVAGEVTAKKGGISKADNGKNFIRSFLNSPYHAIAAIEEYRDVGIAIRDNFDVGTVNPRVSANIDFGYKLAAGPQRPQIGSLRTYPCDGSVGINASMFDEVPSPVPTRNLAANPLGTTIVVVGDDVTSLVISSASMENSSTAEVITLRNPVTAKNDPYGFTYLKSNHGYVTADAPLSPLTTYKVTLKGTNNGKSFERIFSFTTGNL